mgnify:CR=1 FL=1
MLTLRGIITLIVLIVLFALAVVWISKQGGWKDSALGHLVFNRSVSLKDSYKPGM